MSYVFSTPYHQLQCYKLDSGGQCVAPHKGKPKTGRRPPCECTCTETPGRCPCPERLVLFLRSSDVMSITQQPDGTFVDVHDGMRAKKIEYMGAFPIHGRPALPTTLPGGSLAAKK